MSAAPLTFAEVFGLPLAVNMRTAARALGINVQTAYRMVHEDRFPCEVIRVGYHYRIPTISLMNALGIDQFPIDIEHLENGVQLALEMEEPR
ncbi:helix-turn-helix domain-containing protein [Actinomadura sp. WMMB 499]|uniref:helix-turn-helix domain-containing protein n=1 Tax=Actinomadura sp. WMMB 499 TaxID=1219491 RepID=UPI001248ED0A|nr:helix-turn-helix domain-containing protein [Actinomadura sp. WMMB 499]QFG24676.1 helix-turn-helix domain-containing protein [Actinomadura sp. WMMB 499]